MFVTNGPQGWEAGIYNVSTHSWNLKNMVSPSKMSGESAQACLDYASEAARHEGYTPEEIELAIDSLTWEPYGNQSE